MPSEKVPDIVVGRLPIYLRALAFLAAEGREITSSQELGDRLGISSAQIRKDLSHFGEFGKQGTGYDIRYLAEQLRRILKVDRIWPVVLVGAGDLGHALANYGGFEGRGFRIVAVFDSDPEKIGRPLGKLVVQDSAHMEDFIRRRGIQIGIIAVPAFAAQKVAKRMVQVGVKAILNYAPITLSVPNGIHVQYIDPAAGLQRMTYYLSPSESQA
ncbi:MAG TPA: redox-sensing transcriptional repressor Rex [Anaerolineae bacterium]|nr:redox-sensing transcriptional repressor Rex [Anaerolineae bacterium]